MVSECKTYGFKAEVIDLEDFDAEEMSELDEGALCIFLVATYGEGEPTDNAQEFYEWLTDAEGDDLLSNVNYAVFGLGNSQYEFFNAMGEFFDDRLNDLGATRLLARGVGDDDVGSIEDQFEEWKAMLWPIVSLKFLGKAIDALSTEFESQLNLTIVTPAAMPEFDVDLSSWLPYPTDEKTSSIYHTMATTIEFPFSHIDLRRVVLDVRKRAPDGTRITPSLLLPTRHHSWMEHVALATVVDKHEARPSRKDGSTLHCQFNISSLKSSNGLFFKYKSADNLGIVVANADVKVREMVKLIFKRAKDASDEEDSKTEEELEGHALEALLRTVIRVRPKDTEIKLKIPVPSVVSIGNLFKWYLDISSVPTKKQLAVLSQFATDDGERESLCALLKSEGGIASDKREKFWNIRKVLQRYPSINIDLEAIIQILRPLQPRLYTISSSDKASPGKVSITAKLEYEKGALYGAVDESKDGDDFVVVESDKGFSGKVGDGFVGVCSRYVYDMKIDDAIQLYVTASSFRLPSHSTPVIMVGAGAGLAPFRAFVQEGNYLLSSKKASELADWWLFFGCRWKDVDYIYKDFLESSTKEKGGCLTQLCCAFSRDQKKKVYVQDLIKENGEALYHLLTKEKGRVFVCGGPAMGNAVRAAFGEILAEYKVKFEDKKTLEIAEMLKNGQYVQELW
jgi:NADPH-ferrihemoprotein reductase